MQLCTGGGLKACRGDQVAHIGDGCLYTGVKKKKRRAFPTRIQVKKGDENSNCIHGKNVRGITANSADRLRFVAPPICQGRVFRCCRGLRDHDRDEQLSGTAFLIFSSKLSTEGEREGVEQDGRCFRLVRKMYGLGKIQRSDIKGAGICFYKSC